MSDSSERLSERLREQVAALHEPDASESPTLGREAQRRVVQLLVAEASKLERRRRQRVWLGSGAGALLLAAALLLAYLRTPEPQPTAAKAVQPSAASCSLPVVTSAELMNHLGKSFALGALGELVTQPDTQLSVESSGPCELALRLGSGTLAGDLHSLRPARLLIRTDHGEVIVTGTRFSVHSDAELEVLLETGVVDVALQGAGKLRLQPRTRLHKGERVALSSADAQRLDGWLKPQPVAAPAAAVQPEPAEQHKPLFESSHAALTAAEAAWRAQRWSSARDAYRFASQAKDSNAEIALLRWARVELDHAAPATALRLVAEHKRRFARGVLGLDARFIEVQAHKALGHSARAEQAARALIQRYPESPQAAAARKLIEAE
jgi:hypothetical protein